VKVEPEVIDAEEKEMLEDLIAAAVNQALENAQKRSQEEMNKVSGGLMGNLPGGFKFPGM
jgi:DNA-binding protein YbaB